MKALANYLSKKATAGPAAARECLAAKCLDDLPTSTIEMAVSYLGRLEAEGDDLPKLVRRQASELLDRVSDVRV